MKRGLLIAVAGAAVATGLVGCAKADNASSATSSSATPSGASAAAGPVRVTIGGRPQNVSGPVVCGTTNGKFSIAVGDMVTGIIVALEPDASAVHGAGLGTVDGVVMSFTEGVPGEDATATKAGSTYKITGTASGTDNAGAQAHKPFEVNVTCP
ncbi:lipoprotein LpqH [Mycobacterium interjectum]|uniref:lipoprotein LpqH n=1 Tax=Mycobacterium interjectum TaxID=33895 RepID=UPI000831D96F|nr:lipoprotein LpqH [Mycobacterium interjectum]MCV7088833.1 lipoprotein LpqH [Mycobacterium interjectum]